MSADAAVLRQFCAYLRRLSGRPPVQEPIWPQLPPESNFMPYILSKKDVHQLLELCKPLARSRFRARLYRALILLLYCTGLRFGGALRLRMREDRLPARFSSSCTPAHDDRTAALQPLRLCQAWVATRKLARDAVLETVGRLGAALGVIPGSIMAAIDRQTRDPFELRLALARYQPDWPQQARNWRRPTAAAACSSPAGCSSRSRRRTARASTA